VVIVEGNASVNLTKGMGHTDLCGLAVDAGL